MHTSQAKTNDHGRAYGGLPRRLRALLLPAVAVVVALLGASACGPQPSATSTAQPTATIVRSATAAPPTPTLSSPAAEAFDAAQKQLAAKLGVPAANVKLVKQEAVDWPDTSLGCPEPGKAYAQVITPGYRLVLGASDKTYEYHTDRAGHVVSCQ